MTSTSLGSDGCSYKEQLRRSVGPGMYMLGTPNNDVLPCSQEVPADPYMRFQHWGAGTCAPGSAVDDSSELLGLRYLNSKCSADAYAPGKYSTKGICNVPGNTDPRVCMPPTEDTRLSNPPCTLKSTGINRWEWLCYDPQDKAIIPFEWNTSYRIIAKDNHVPCLATPLNQDAVHPNPRSTQPASIDWANNFTQNCDIKPSADTLTASFSTCKNIANNVK